MDEMAAHDAWRTLNDVPEPRKEATTRVVGLTWMVWGLAFAVGMLATAVLGQPSAKYAAEGEFLAFLVGAGAPVFVAAFITSHLWRAHGVLPSGRPGLVLAGVAVASVLGGYLLIWPMALLSLIVTGGDLFAPILPRYTVAGLGGLFAVTIWVWAFGWTRWNAMPKGRRWTGWLGGAFMVLSIPLGMIAVIDGYGMRLASILAAFIVMTSFTFIGARLYARG